MRHSEEFHQWLEASGISKTNAEAVVANPEKSEVLELEGGILQLFVRRTDRTTPPTTALVTAEQMPGEEPTLHSVIRVFDSFSQDLAQFEPSELLHWFAERFGRPIYIGKTVKKLLLAESVLMDDDDLKAPIGPKIGPKDATLTTMSMRGAKNPNRLQCLMCFALDLDAYGSYLAKPS